MRKTILYLIILFSLFSCTKQVNEKGIEIYLTNNVILSNNSIPIYESDSLMNDISKNVDSTNFVYLVRALVDREYDTISKRSHGKGEFKTTINDLSKTPIVFDSEIDEFNIDTGIIKIKNSGIERIENHIGKNKGMFTGLQYVITYNEKPIFNGYFVSILSSRSINWYVTLHTTHKNSEKGNFKLLKPFTISTCNCSNEEMKNIPKLNSNKKLIEAFRETNRLIE